ncbi:MAG: metal-dependent hydrolase [Saprospiraceae bacterium]|jgi:L-ascorbate metabolism protein UlaG (beta-lactamase superfamily)
MRLSYYGHACFMLEISGQQLLIDPFIISNPNVENFDIAQIRPDYILVSHAHGDHIAELETIVGNSGAQLISNYEIISYYAQKGIYGHAMNHGGKYQFEFGTVKYVNAVHTSTFPDGSNGGQPGGFVIWNDHNCIYFAGDTALTLDMKLIPMTCPKLDAAVLPIGDNFTMGYEDASIAAEFVKCDTIVGCHYNTFPPISINLDEARKTFEEKGIKLHMPAFGESLEF